MCDIDKKYGVPREEISCPSCGQKYGHHKTKVDTNTQECVPCAKLRGGEINEITAEEFIEKTLGYKPS